MSKRVADFQINKDGTTDGGGEDATSNFKASAAQLAKRKIIQPRSKFGAGGRPANSPSFPPPSMSFPPATQPVANNQSTPFQSSSFNFASQSTQPIFGAQNPATTSGFTGSMFNIPAAQPQKPEAGAVKWPPSNVGENDVPTWASSSPYHFGENLATTTPANGFGTTAASNGFGTHQSTNGAAANGSTIDLDDTAMQTSPQPQATSPEAKVAPAEPKSLFGTLSQEPAKEVKSLFGNTATTTATDQQSLFGAASTPKPAAAQQNLFGSAATPKPAAETQSLFGGSSAAPKAAATTQPLFGSSTVTTQPTAENKTLFGDVGSSTDKPTAKFTFGQTSNWGQTNAFAQPSTTPALVPRDPSAPNMFAPKSANGDAQKTDSAAATALKNELFTPQTAEKSEAPAKSVQATPTTFAPGLFSNAATTAPQTTASSNLFAPKPSEPSAESMAVPQTPTTSNLFAPKAPAAATPAQTTSNLFTPQPSNPVPDTATTEKPQAPLFGSSMQTPAPSSNIFGAAQTPAANIFGTPKPSAEEVAPAKPNLFAPSSTNIFNQASSQAQETPKPAGGNLFNTPQHAQTPASNLFGQKPVDLSKFKEPSATSNPLGSQPPTFSFGESNAEKATPAKPSFKFGQNPTVPAFTPSQPAVERPQAENPFANMLGGSVKTTNQPANEFALAQTKDAASQVPSPSTALVPFTNNQPPPQATEPEDIEIDYTIQNIMTTLEIPPPPASLPAEQRDQYDLGFKLIALQKAAKAHVTERIFNLEKISQPFINALNQKLAELKRSVKQSKRKADIEDDEQSSKRVKMTEQTPVATPSKTSSNTSRLFASIANDKGSSTPARSSPLKNVQNASPIPATPSNAGKTFTADFSDSESEVDDEEQVEQDAGPSINTTAFSPSKSNNLFTGLGNSTPAKFEPPKFAPPPPTSTPFKFGESNKAVDPPKAIGPPKFTMPSSSAIGPGGFLAQFGKAAEETASKERAKRKAEEYDSEEETEEQWEERDKREQAAKRAKFAEEGQKAPGFVFKPTTSSAASPAPKSPTKNVNPDLSASTTSKLTRANPFALSGKSVPEDAANEAGHREEHRDADQDEPKSSPRKILGPPTFSVPQFGSGAPVNFMAEFSKSAEETAAKEKARRKEEDYDSEEETEEQWEERYKKEQAEKKAKLAEAARSAPGFQFVPKVTASTTALETTSIPTKPPSPVKANPLFKPGNTSNSPLAPPLFGSLTPAAKPAGLFNSVARNADTPKQTSGLFGSTAPPSQSLFGSSTPASKSLFGSSTPAAQPPTNLFGKVQTPKAASPPPAPVAEQEDEDEEDEDDEQEEQHASTSSFGMLGNHKTGGVPKTADTSSGNVPATNPFASATKVPTFAPTTSSSNLFKPASSGFGSGLFGTPGKLTEASASELNQDKTWTPAKPIKFGGESTTTPATTAKPGLLFPETPLTSATPSLFGNALKPAGSNLFGGVVQATPTSNPFAPKSLAPGTGLFGSAPKPLGVSLNNAASNVTSRASTPADSQAQDDDNAEGNDEDAAEPEAQIDLVASAAGEENEDTLYTVRAKARVLVPLGTADGANGWETRGVGTLKLLKNKDTGKTRLLLRAEPSAKVVMNTNLIKTMKYQVETGAKNTVGFGAPSTDGKIQRWLITVKTADLSAELAKELEAAK